MIEFVLKSGALPNTRVEIDNWHGDTPMSMACHTKKDRKQELPDEKLETMEKLSKKFTITKPNFKDMLFKSIELLLKYNACPFIANANGISPLSKVSCSLNEPILQLMCNAKPSQGTDINAKNEKNQTALTVALDALIHLIQAKKMANVSVIQSLLLKNADPNVSYDDGDTAFMKAIKTSHVPLVMAFLEKSTFSIDHNCQSKSKFVELLEIILH